MSAESACIGQAFIANYGLVSGRSFEAVDQEPHAQGVEPAL